MADEAQNPAPSAAAPAAPAATPASNTQHEHRIVVEAGKSKDDPTLSRLFASEKANEDLKAQIESLKGQVKQFERDGRKQGILGALYDGHPGLSREEIRGMALVAQEDGKVDLYSPEGDKQIEVLKELLKAKAQAAQNNPAPRAPVSPVPSSPAPAANLGGTPGAPAKPPVGARNTRDLRWRI